MVDSEQVHAICQEKSLQWKSVDFYLLNISRFWKLQPSSLRTPLLLHKVPGTQSSSPSPCLHGQKHTTLVKQTLFPDILARHRVLKAVQPESHSACVLWILPSKNIAVIYCSYDESLSIDLILVIPEARLLNFSFSFLPVNPYSSLNVSFYCFQPKILTIILHAYFSVNHSLFNEHLPYFGIILVVLGFVFIELTQGHKIRVIKKNTKQNRHMSLGNSLPFTRWSLRYVKLSQNWIMLYSKNKARS